MSVSMYQYASSLSQVRSKVFRIKLSQGEKIKVKESIQDHSKANKSVWAKAKRIS